ncbi:hypothetical protein [Mesorhizobium sp. B2-3-10]|uniref:hypothetical protein n=1 Tax=Mesorhizobium sp. B2-3-10 TaxID=2589954 RepID=UPI00112C4785|nr:hypothetical protein [Mesorhizobium sp. B2-3-10]TPL98308.1 hypothetical protein FJ943_15500 [Mesorhizobium sp. B2-3-10]
MKRSAGIALFALGFLTACSQSPAEEVKPDPQKELLGRWESPEFSRAHKPLFVQVEDGGAISFLNKQAMVVEAKWMRLTSGELQVTYPAGSSRRCKVSVDKQILTIDDTRCLQGWDDVPPGVSLIKQ